MIASIPKKNNKKTALKGKRIFICLLVQKYISHNVKKRVESTDTERKNEFQIFKKKKKKKIAPNYVYIWEEDSAQRRILPSKVVTIWGFPTWTDPKKSWKHRNEGKGNLDGPNQLRVTGCAPLRFGANPVNK